MKLLNKLKQVGKLEQIEIKSASFILALVGVGIYIYTTIIIEIIDVKSIEIVPLRNFLIFLFLFSASIPFTKKRIILDNYGWFIFLPFFLYCHYIIYVLGLNKFSMDLLIGAYIIIFGSFLILSNRILIIISSSTEFAHVLWQVFNNDIDRYTQDLVILSISTIFVFSLLITNNIIRHKKHLKKISIDLEARIKNRTADLESYSKELFEKNEDLENFASVISHDLKTPLRNIHSLSSWLVEDNSEKFDNETNEKLAIIMKQVNQMDLLIDGVLNYTLNDAHEDDKSDVDLNLIIDTISSPIINERCKISKLKKLPTIKFNEAQIYQVFQNLILNAITHNDKKDIEVQIDYGSNDRTHLFFVCDNGPGIEERYFSRIFQLFQQLDNRSTKGSVGLGLAIVKKIINRNGGEIWLKSKRGKGTKFYFSLPRQKTKPLKLSS